MKKSIYSFFSAALMSLAFVSCANDDSVAGNGNNGENGDKGNLVTFNATLPQPTGNTRVTLTDPRDGTGIKCVWKTGDNICVFNATKGTKETFSLTSGGTTGIGTFDGYPTTDYKEKDVIDAYYPSTIIINTSGLATINYAIQHTSGKLDNIAPTTTMFATTYYKKDGTANLVFKQICSMLRINVNTGFQTKIKSVKLLADGLLTSATYIPGIDPSGVPTWNTSTKGEITVDLGDGIATDANGKLSTPVYMQVFPQALANGFTITVTDIYDGTFTYTNSNKVEFKQGKVHEINVTDAKMVRQGVIPGYYMWDAAEPVVLGVNEYSVASLGDRFCNTTTSYNNNWNKNIPTIKDMYHYIVNRDFYIGKLSDADKFTVTLTDGSTKTCTYGAYFKKKQYITDFDNALPSDFNYTPTNGIIYSEYAKGPDDWEAVTATEKTKYFVVPLFGVVRQDGYVAPYYEAQPALFDTYAFFWLKDVKDISGKGYPYEVRMDSDNAHRSLRVAITQSSSNPTVHACKIVEAQ